jgi:hypothetical protein
MRKRTSSTDGYAARTYLPSFIVGRERFARISAVEGIALTDEMRETFARFDQQGLSAEERRRTIVSRFTRTR